MQETDDTLRNGQKDNTLRNYPIGKIQSMSKRLSAMLKRSLLLWDFDDTPIQIFNSCIKMKSVRDKNVVLTTASIIAE